jgi:hypothetical protein
LRLVVLGLLIPAYLTGGVICVFIATRIVAERRCCTDPDKRNALMGSIQAFSVGAFACFIYAGLAVLKL